MRKHVIHLVSILGISSCILLACGQGSVNKDNDVATQDSGSAFQDKNIPPDNAPQVNSGSKDDDSAAKPPENTNPDPEKETDSPSGKLKIATESANVAKMNPGINGAILKKAKTTVAQYCQDIYDTCDKAATSIPAHHVCSGNYIDCTDTSNCEVKQTVCGLNSESGVDCGHEFEVCVLADKCETKKDNCITENGAVGECMSPYNACLNSIESHLVECAKSKDKCISSGNGVGECMGFYQSCKKNL